MCKATMQETHNKECPAGEGISRGGREQQKVVQTVRGVARLKLQLAAVELGQDPAEGVMPDRVLPVWAPEGAGRARIRGPPAHERLAGGGPHTRLHQRAQVLQERGRPRRSVRREHPQRPGLQPAAEVSVS